MTDWTAITGIVVAGVVGPTIAALWAARNQAKAAENAIVLADRAAARTMLNGAALAVREAIGRAAAVQSAADYWGHKLGTEGGVEEMAAFHDASRGADLLGPGVRMMFSDGRPVAEAYADCLSALDRIARGANMIRGITSGVEIIPADRAGDQDWTAGFLEDVMEGLKEAEAAHQRLLEAGHEAIGVRG